MGISSEVIGYWILAVNIAILCIVTYTMFFNYMKAHNGTPGDIDYNFYLMQLQSSISFGVANYIAAYVNYRGFFVLDGFLPPDLSFLRYVDRICMFFHSLYLLLLSKKYIPHWFK